MVNSNKIYSDSSIKLTFLCTFKFCILKDFFSSSKLSFWEENQKTKFEQVHRVTEKFRRLWLALYFGETVCNPIFSLLNEE